MNAYKRIRKAMRENEVELLAHIRENRIDTCSMLGRAWMGALDRLTDAGMVRYSKASFCYRARKGARPVTGAIQ